MFLQIQRACNNQICSKLLLGQFSFCFVFFQAHTYYSASLSAHILIQHPLPLSGTADGNYGPVLPFVQGPLRDRFGQHTILLIQTASVCLFIKIEAKECMRSGQDY